MKHDKGLLQNYLRNEKSEICAETRKSRKKTASISSGYVEAFLSKTDDVAGQRSLFAVGESFATGPIRFCVPS